MTPIPDAPTFPDRHTVLFERTFEAPVERVWHMLSEPEEMARWFMPTTLEPRVGGRFSCEGGWDGTISTWEPGRCFQFDADEGGITRFAIEPDGTGTRFTLTDRLPPDISLTTEGATWQDMPVGARQPGGPGTHWPGVLAGWHGFVDALACHLEGRDCPFDYPAMVEQYGAWVEHRWKS